MTLEAFLSVQMGRVKSAAAEIQQREARRQPAEGTKAVPESLPGWPVHMDKNYRTAFSRTAMGYLQSPRLIRNA